MLEFVILNTNITELNYSYTPEPGKPKIDLEIGTSTMLLRNEANPKMVIMDAIVEATSENTNLNFLIKTRTFIDLKIDMSDAEINIKCMPLVCTAVNEKIRAITGCMQSPHIELPPIQQLVENMIFPPKK